MAHLHKVYDNDTHFKINPNTRTFLNESEVKNTIAQGDHNSERITFEVQRYVDGHDMSLCNRIEIHYLNIDTTTKEQSNDVYISDDVTISPEDENLVEFSWLISENATKYNGILSFAISMKCLTGDVVDYKWNTLTYEKLSVGKSLNNVAAIQETVSDIIAKWKQELVSSGAIDLSNLVTKEEFNQLKGTIVNQAEVDDEGIVSFKNDSGVVLFTLDMSEFSGGANTYGELVLSTETLEVKEGASGTFTVKLETAPTTNQIVYLALSDNTKLSIAPSTLTFTTSDYDVEQTVTVTALQDEDANDETVTIALTSKKVSAKQLVVSIDDDEFIAFSGKEIASHLDFSTWSLTTDNEDGQPRCTDIANDEIIIGIGNNNGLIKPLEQFTSGTSQITGPKSKAGEKIANNTSGNYTFLFILEKLPEYTVPDAYPNGIGAISYIYWKSDFSDYIVYYNLACMKYLNTSGETIDLSFKNVATDVSSSVINGKGWTKYYSACVLHNDGRVEFHLNGVPIHITEPIEGFVSWVWKGYGWSTMSYQQSRFGNTNDEALIINDAVTPQEVIDYYEYRVATEETAF